ncbi:MAG: helix-turn-helix domain-containing protein [Bauldia sp.]|nr:helix-turn-helix domain-containing protein [Bauldia sp.]
MREISRADHIASRIAEFSDELGDKLWAVDMFNSIPDIYFYVKDRESRWIVCNDASVRFLGVKTKSHVYGMTERDFFPKAIADSIRADDREVIFKRKKIIGRTEIVLDECGLLTWASTNKIPLVGKSGQIVGLMGTTRILKRADDLPETFQQFRRVVDHVQKNISRPINIVELSREAHLSQSQFRKRFRGLFGVSPNEFILRTRLQRAARLLKNTDDALIRIALDCGFCDQSYFTKRFRDFFGATPRRYRQTAPRGIEPRPDTP